MTTDSSKIQNWTQFVVIESIPDGQPHTGKKIFEDLQTHCAYHGFTLSLKYMAVRSKDELCTALDAVEIDARLNGHRPILHIECHGSDDEKGLVLSDDSFVGWEELKPILTAINFHSGFNLLIVLSLCNGGYLTEIIDLTDRAPCWGLIGPLKPVPARLLLDGFGAFYRVFLSTLNGDLAVAELFRLKPTVHYVYAPAEGFFRKVYSEYLRDHTTEDAYALRAKKIIRQLRDDSVHVGRRAMIRRLKKFEKVAFEKYKRHFFMIDHFPLNAKRFKTSYEDVKALSLKSPKASLA